MRTSLASTALALGMLVSPLSAETLRVGDFGARGDGWTDDTPALQQAFNALRSGDELHFDSGRVYLISKSVSLRGKSGYRIVGNGATIKMKNGVPASKYLFYISENSNYVWSRLTFDGNRTNRPGPRPESGDQGWYHNVIISGGSGFSFERVRSVNSYQDGFYLTASNQRDPGRFPRDGEFIDCEALYNWRQGLTIVNAFDIEVQGGSYSYTQGDWPMAGINIEARKGSAVPGVKGVTIRGARMMGNKGFGLTAGVARPEDILIDGNYFSDNAQGGVRIAGRSMTVQRNLFDGFQRAITTMAYGGRLNTVTRGIIDVTANGENRDARILGNTFRNIRVGKAIVYVHHRAGDGAEIRDNCFEDFVVPAIVSGKRSGITIANNAENPAEGCPDPRGFVTQ